MKVRDGARDAREGRSRASGQPRRRLRQGRAPAARAAHARPPALSAAARRAATRGASACRGSWRCDSRPSALREIVDAHGPDAVAFYASGQLLDRGVLRGRQARQGLPRHQQLRHQLAPLHGLGGGRLRALAGRRRPARRLRRTSSAPTASCSSAPTPPTAIRSCSSASGKRKLDAPDDVSVIVADPRWTETADLADLHLPLRPGSDIALLNGDAARAVAGGPLDQALHRRAHDAAGTTLRARDRALPARARRGADRAVRREHRRRRRAAFGRARAALTLWSMGINQSHVGTDKNAAILNLHLATGQIGRPGAGPFSLTGQPNAMGGRETGGLAHLLPGYRSVTDADARAAVERHWGVRARTHRARARAARRSRSSRGWPSGEVRAVWIIVHEPGRLDARPRPRREGAPPGGAGDRAGRLPPDRDDALRRRAPARRAVAREGRRHDQLRAPAHATCRSSSSRRARRCPTRRSSRVWPRSWAARRPSPRRAPPRSSTSSPRSRPARRATTPASATRGCAADGPLQWPVPAPTIPGTARLYADGRFPTAGRPRALRRRRARRARRSRPTRASRSRSRPAACAITGTRSRAPGRRRRSCARTPEPLLELNPRDARAPACATATSSRSPRGAGRRSPSAG